MVAEISPKSIMTSNQKFLGESPDQNSWTRFHRIIMSWNVKYFLGDIPGEDFREYLCPGLLKFSGGDSWGQFLRIIMSWIIEYFLGVIPGDNSENNYVQDY